MKKNHPHSIVPNTQNAETPKPQQKDDASQTHEITARANSDDTRYVLVLNETHYIRHPLSKLFGDHDAEDFAGLKRSLRAVGQKRAITVVRPDGNQPDQVLDGWNRLRALQELQITPRIEIYEGDDAIAIVTALNLAQRTLSAGQRALIAAGLANYMRGGKREDAGRLASLSTDSEDPSNDSLHIEENVTQCTDNNQRLNLASDSFLSQSDAYEEKNAKFFKTFSDAAAAVGVSRSYAVRAKKIAREADPSVVDAVRAGKVSLNEAYEAIKSTATSQREWLAERIKQDTASNEARRRAAAPEIKRLRAYLAKKHAFPHDTEPEKATAILNGLLVEAMQHCNLVLILVKRHGIDTSCIEQLWYSVERLKEAAAM